VEPSVYRNIINIRPVIPSIVAIHVDAQAVPIPPAKNARAHQRVHLAVALVKDVIEFLFIFMECLALNLDEHGITEFNAGTLILRKIYSLGIWVIGILKCSKHLITGHVGIGK
jgi:hypothetical protein